MALLQNINFTDPQGVTHPAAVFGVAHATNYTSEEGKIKRDLQDYVTMKSYITSNTNINVQYFYWADEATRVAGNSPYVLFNLEENALQNSSFNFSPSGFEYEGLSLEDQCYYYLQNVILA